MSAEDNGGSEGREKISQKSRGEGSYHLSTDNTSIEQVGAGERISEGQ